MKNFLFVLFICLSFNVYSQRTITGTITDGASLPLSSVIVTVKGTEYKTFSSETGYYSITVPKGHRTLTYQLSNFQVKEVEVNSDVVNITMDAEVDIFDLSLEELMKIEVVSVSKRKEKMNEVPANIIIITKNELEMQGYNSLIDVLENLPGFDMSKSFGSDYFHNYMRGFRSYIGSYYLILIDGLSFDHLWFQDDKALVSFPISNIERIEIIYGPSSSLYGVNALMGLVNIITKKEVAEDTDLNFNGKFSTAFNSLVTADFNIRAKQGIFATSITARMEQLNIKDIVDNNLYEWTSDKYLTDTLLWGGMVNAPSLGGTFSSETKNIGLDARVFIKDTEIGYQFYKMDP